MCSVNIVAVETVETIGSNCQWQQMTEIQIHKMLPQPDLNCCQQRREVASLVLYNY